MGNTFQEVSFPVVAQLTSNEPCREKPSFRVGNQLRLKSTCSAAVITYNVEYLDVADIANAIIQATNKANDSADQTARCADWSALSLLAAFSCRG